MKNEPPPFSPRGGAEGCGGGSAFAAAPSSSPPATDRFGDSASSATELGASRQGSLDGRASRFELDFVKVAGLGKGGFGRVWRVRNKLDSMDYAVKMVPIAAGQDVARPWYSARQWSRSLW